MVGVAGGIAFLRVGLPTGTRPNWSAPVAEERADACDGWRHSFVTVGARCIAVQRNCRTRKAGVRVCSAAVANKQT
jgi:hypothetical protein